MNHAGGISLILKSAGPAGEALDQALRAAGFRVRVAPTVFDVVTEAQRTEGSLQHLFVGVDQWGPDEFRLLPLVRREWPATTIVAYCSPGFAYKGRVAELVGADAVLSSIGDILHFIEGLAPLAEPAPSVAAAAPPVTPQSWAPDAAVGARHASPEEAPQACGRGMPRPYELRAPDTEGIPSPAVKPVAKPAVAAPPEVASVPEPPPPAPNMTRPPASPVQSIPLMRPQYAGSDADDAADDDGIDGEIIGTIELTDEELRLLLGEDEEV